MAAISKPIEITKLLKNLGITSSLRLFDTCLKRINIFPPLKQRHMQKENGSGLATPLHLCPFLEAVTGFHTLRQVFHLKIVSSCSLISSGLIEATDLAGA